jgi:hypothetical protein
MVGSNREYVCRGCIALQRFIADGGKRFFSYIHRPFQPGCTPLR